MDKRIRKRGIKASREKLEIAMLDAGIKSQASLADKIAEREDLSSPPKDTVNRVFREVFVSHATIARIAKVLSVKPGTLYLEQQLENKTNAAAPNGNNNKTKSLPGKFCLALNPITPEVKKLNNSIHKLLKASVKPVVISPSLLPGQCMSIDIARKYQADGVLTIRSNTFDRYQFIQVFLLFESVEQLIWADKVTNIELIQRPDEIAERFIPFFNSFIGHSSGSYDETRFTSIETPEKHMLLTKLLTDHHPEIGLKRAQTLLFAMYEPSPDLTLAQVALADSITLYKNILKRQADCIDTINRLIDACL